MTETTPSPLNNVITIDDERIKNHLDRVVRSSVEETLNALLDAEADRLCNAQRYERSAARRDTRAGHYERNLQTKVAGRRSAQTKCAKKSGHYPIALKSIAEDLPSANRAGCEPDEPESGMYGDLQGLIGSSLQNIPALTAGSDAHRVEASEPPITIIEDGEAR